MPGMLENRQSEFVLVKRGLDELVQFVPRPVN